MGRESRGASWPKVVGAAVLLSACASRGSVSFATADAGVVHADVYGEGRAAVVLAHGGRFEKSSWKHQAPVLAAAGFRVLALDFRGRGDSRAGPGTPPDEGYPLDVLAAVRYLRDTGADSVAVVGASFGGWAAARAAAEVPGEIDRLVLLATTVDEPELLTCPTLFLVTRDDRRGEGVLRLPEIRACYERVPGPKELVVLEGSAHAQYVFDSAEGERMLAEILRFLTAPAVP